LLHGTAKAREASKKKMQTQSKYKNNLRGEKKMKSLGNISRIMALMSAFVLLFGAGAYAASKPGAKQMKVKVKNVTKVQTVTLKHIPPAGTSLGASGRGSTPGSLPGTPDRGTGRCSVDSVRLAKPTKFNGYFLKRYASLQHPAGADGQAGGIAPETVLLPEPLLDPRYELFAQYFQKLGLFWITDKIDPRFLPFPGWEGPNPCVNGGEDYFWYIIDNRNSNILSQHNIRFEGSLENLKPAALRKAMEIMQNNRGETDGERNDANWTLDGICNGDGKGKDGKGNDSGSDDSGGSDDGGKPTKPDATAGKPVEETDSQPDADKDSDPEGDDPDEFRTPTSDKGAIFAASSATPVTAARHQAASGSSGYGGSGSGNQGSMPQGGGLPNDPRNNPSYRDPEGGRPDEAGTPATASGALNGKVNAGQNLQPEPGGQDPHDPRASEGSMRATGASLGYAASPPDGGQGGDTGPIGPEYFQ
jgi:hypothetical protein